MTVTSQYLLCQSFASCELLFMGLWHLPHWHLFSAPHQRDQVGFLLLGLCSDTWRTRGLMWLRVFKFWHLGLKEKNKYLFLSSPSTTHLEAKSTMLLTTTNYHFRFSLQKHPSKQRLEKQEQRGEVVLRISPSAPTVEKYSAKSLEPRNNVSAREGKMSHQTSVSGDKVQDRKHSVSI